MIFMPCHAKPMMHAQAWSPEDGQLHAEVGFLRKCFGWGRANMIGPGHQESPGQGQNPADDGQGNGRKLPEWGWAARVREPACWSWVGITAAAGCKCHCHTAQVHRTAKLCRGTRFWGGGGGQSGLEEMTLIMLDSFARYVTWTVLEAGRKCQNMKSNQVLLQVGTTGDQHHFWDEYVLL